MQDQSQFYGKRSAYLLFLLLSLIPVQVLLSLQGKSPTFDETPHLFAGYSYLKTGDFRMNPEHPPLSFILGALPLLALDVKFPREPALWAQSDVYTMGWRFVFFENDAEKLLFWARFPMIGLGILLGYFIYRWAQELYGEEAGLFAALLYIFCPNMLAHVGLINTDFPITTFMFLACYFFSKWASRVTFRHFLQTSVAFSLALLSKNSAILLVPGFLLMGLVWILIRENREREAGEPGRGKVPSPNSPPPTPSFPSKGWQKGLAILLLLISMGIVGYLALWAGYGFRYEAMKEPVGEFITPWEQVTPPSGFIKEASLFIREHKLLPEAYTYGLLYTHRTTQKRWSFLAGAYSVEGWWYYFIVAFLIKTPLPFLMLLGLAGLSYLFKESSRKASKDALWTRELFVILPPTLYFAFSLTTHINIGLRHILPVYPFLFILVSRLVSRVYQKRAVAGKIALGVLAAWFIVCSLRIYPDYLAYFNELVGGPDQGYKYLVDSNLDWGQDLKGLKKYMDDHGIEKINLAYFGTADPEYYGIHHHRLPGFINYTEPQPVGTLDLRYPIAISATLLQGVPTINPELYKGFLAMKPVAKIGYSIFIYKLEAPGLETRG